MFWARKAAKTLIGSSLGSKRTLWHQQIMAAEVLSTGWLGKHRLFRGQELQPVTERIVRVEAAHAGEIRIPFDADVVKFKTRGDGIEVPDEDAGVRLRCSVEDFLNAEVHFDAAAPEPATAPGSKHRRLLQLGETEDHAPELPARVLGSRRHRQLDVVEPGKCAIRGITRHDAEPSLWVPRVHGPVRAAK